MVKRTGGTRRKTRHKLTKPIGEKGKLSLRRYLQEFKEGEKVVLKLDSIVQNGAFHPRFIGKIGVVKKKTGTCYEIKIKDINKEKVVVAHPIHLKRC